MLNIHTSPWKNSASTESSSIKVQINALYVQLVLICTKYFYRPSSVHLIEQGFSSVYMPGDAFMQYLSSWPTCIVHETEAVFKGGQSFPRASGSLHIIHSSLKPQ